MSTFLLLIAVVGTLAVFATTRAGGEVLKRIGLRDRVSGAAPSDDVDYLRNVCGGDTAEVERRLADERDRYPHLSEAEHYRRAIRKVFNERS